MTITIDIMIMFMEWSSRVILSPDSVFCRLVLAVFWFHSTSPATSRMLVNILFMAPRMVYFSMIYLLWSIFVEASTTIRPVVYGP